MKIMLLMWQFGYYKKRKVDFILYHPEKWIDALVIQSK